MNGKNIKNGFINIRIIHTLILRLLKNKDSEIFQLIKQSIDSRFLKIIEINNDCIIFKANKKFRDKDVEDETFSKKYISVFLSKIFNEIITDYDITTQCMNVMIDIVKDDNKVIVEFN